jgi:Rap1a immunity proteins
MIRRGTAAIVVALALSAGTASAQDGNGSANDFLSQYDAADAQARQLLEMFIVGQERGLLTANQYLKVEKSKNALYCPPGDAALTPPQLVETVRDLVSRDGRAGAAPLSVVVLMALQRSYPCPKSPPPGH